jgi:hypothetical protein
MSTKDWIISESNRKTIEKELNGAFVLGWLTGGVFFSIPWILMYCFHVIH